METFETTSAIEFSAMARHLAVTAHRLSLSVPGFRTPPRLAGRSRTVRRYPDGSVLVSVLARGRSHADVLHDMVEGVLVVNGLSGAAGQTARTALHAALQPSDAKAA